MRVADSIFQNLRSQTDTIYMVPGGGAMYLVDAVGRSGLRVVSAIHEQGAGYMAIGHAMTTRGLGVCLVTSGPGATNALTACLAAWTDSIPILFISGQARTEAMKTNTRARGLQYADIVNITKPMTKYSCEPMTAREAIFAHNSMIELCLSGRRGPCWLSVPQDVQGEEV